MKKLKTFKQYSINDLAIELMKKSLEGEKFESWQTDYHIINNDMEFVCHGILNTSKKHVDGLVYISYYGCNFKIWLDLDNSLVDWCFSVKCESQMYSFWDNGKETETGSNWNNCFLPDCARFIDWRKEYFEKAKEYIYDAI